MHAIRVCRSAASFGTAAAPRIPIAVTGPRVSVAVTASRVPVAGAAPLPWEVTLAAPVTISASVTVRTSVTVRAAAAVSATVAVRAAAVTPGITVGTAMAVGPAAVTSGISVGASAFTPEFTVHTAPFTSGVSLAVTSCTAGRAVAVTPSTRGVGLGAPAVTPVAALGTAPGAAGIVVSGAFAAWALAGLTAARRVGSGFHVTSPLAVHAIPLGPFRPARPPAFRGHVPGARAVAHRCARVRRTAHRELAPTGHRVTCRRLGRAAVTENRSRIGVLATGFEGGQGRKPPLRRCTAPLPGDVVATGRFDRPGNLLRATDHRCRPGFHRIRPTGFHAHSGRLEPTTVRRCARFPGPIAESRCGNDRFGTIERSLTAGRVGLRLPVPLPGRSLLRARDRIVLSRTESRVVPGSAVGAAHLASLGTGLRGVVRELRRVVDRGVAAEHAAVREGAAAGTVLVAHDARAGGRVRVRVVVGFGGSLLSPRTAARRGWRGVAFADGRVEVT
ncbi:hypothetical protein [Nocardia sp. NPDC005825]|uniref:hypothetical protein n=1 Tax=unclassified Nocardia TaxID=2637762 RepID=UPI0033D996E6